ncbi:hypothetical protein AQUCO_05300110v1 [Aquilegia coerulea]|uniref:UvrD-like helicase ATP-binding domain-containing protein n=1 Tax=Aquilegia coerulea TaxID=218851 RepID=A0A2G5CID4_AQUCA|nr:hypothetical protein AQUCO_05300110v1 [Aquilegia coerulea]
MIVRKPYSRNKITTHDSGLIRKVFSWTLEDIFNDELYSHKVEKIPESFQSEDHYLRSFIYPLLEETRAELCSSLEVISHAPFAEVIKCQRRMPMEYFFYEVEVDAWKNRNASGGQDLYKPKPGDIYVLTDAIPETVSDLERFGRTWNFALVTYVPEDELMKKKNDTSAVNDDDISPKMFKFKSSNSIMMGEGMRTSLFTVFLMNITTNNRIWISLNKLGSMKILKEVFFNDSVVDRTCNQCSSLHADNIQDEKFGTTLSLLDDSQAGAVRSCISTIKCNHRSTVKLVWGPPGTGKTKTVSTLLCTLLRMKHRTLACAPTNVAIIELSARVLNLLKESYAIDPEMSTSLFTLGDILLFGNNDRLKVEGDLEEIFLDNRVELLEEFLARSGWKFCFINMIDFLKNCVSQFNIHIENESKKETVFSKEKELERSSDHSFLSFTRKRYIATSLQLKRCVSTLITHLSVAFLRHHNFQDMAILLGLLDSFESLLSQDDVVEEELKEHFAQIVEENASLSALTGSCPCETVKSHISSLLCTIRSDSLIVSRSLLKSLSDLDIPIRMSREDIRDLCFQTASLFFCTASCSFKLHSVGIEPLDLVVIDEAAQLKEGESTIPLQLMGIQHAFLIGDECQLPARVHSKVSNDAGFGRSLFQRMSSAGCSKHLLNMQYRMHPNISCFPNSMFYLNKILDAPNVKSQSYVKHYLPGPMFGPYSFISVSNGIEEVDDVGHSRRNYVEAALVMTIVRNLFKAWEKSREKVSIGIVSPYAAQVAAIQKNLGRKYEKIKGFDVNVNSIDGFQGGEQDIIIITTVRSNSGGAIGFLANPQRSNVGLTRAKHCLWILGNGTTLARSDSVWTELVNNAKDRKCFFHADDDKDLAKAILQVKKELDQLDDLLNGDSILFRTARWKVLFSDNFKKSFGNLKSSQRQKSVLNLLLKLSCGWRPKRNVDCVCENSSQFVKQFKVDGVYVISTIDIVKQSTYTQVLKIWDILPLDEIQNLMKRLDNIFGMYTDDLISRCKVKCMEGSLEVPMTWGTCANIVRYKKCSTTDSGIVNVFSGASSSRCYVENSKVSESLLLMKFYSLSSGVVGQLLSGCDGREIDLPFEVTDQELEIIQYPRSSFILGRSGTGKTTVLTMKLIQKEQQYYLSSEGLCDVKDDTDVGFHMRNEISENPGDNRGTMLRQLFVTVSPKLCAAIKNHISNLMRFTREARSQRDNNAGDMHDIDDTTQFKDVPDSFVGITSRTYPLVVTFQKFLMMLDRSMDDSYFDRFHEVKELSFGRSGTSSSAALQVFIRTKEVTFDCFNSFYWPHFNSQWTKKLDASTVFTEIISHIKGGLRAGKVFEGKLNRDDYVSLAENRVSSINRDRREKIYDIFLDYEKKKMQNGHFDLADFVNDLHHRLRFGCYGGELMDFVYIDEVQDLTMRQIALFKYVCKNIDEGYVFSGDTAQTIARGIDFRFQDIKSLFYDEFLLGSGIDAKDTINGKDQPFVSDIFHLDQNFRTHAGVLSLSESVLDLLYRYFPLSVDILSPETSLIYGEAPVLLESGTDENAIVTIFGNSGINSGNMIGFGAEQVILVRDECARTEISDYVGKQALVLTILECKGLEFQDVLLYNFFGTSPLKKQWRVVYEYMNEHNLLDPTSPQSFPSFDEAKHTILCSELKQLYVAITRTRQRLWICENIEEFSKPIFDYWKNLCLVQTRQLDDSLAQAMQVASSDDEWRSRGIKLFNEGNFEMATMCFERAGDSYREKWARAAGLRASSDRLRGSNSELAHNALQQAAKIYESINKAESAALCFIELKEYKRAGMVYLEICGDSRLEDAGDCFVLAGCWSHAADSYARGNHIAKCLSSCMKGELFGMGLKFIKRWKGSASNGGDKTVKIEELENLEQDFLESCALHYHKRKDPKTMMTFVREFHSMKSIRKFLRSRNYLDYLMSLEEEFGNFIEASNIAGEKGDLPSQADLLAKGGRLKDAGDIFSSAACWSRAAEMYARGNYVSKCLSACIEGELFDMGLDFIKKWKGNEYESVDMTTESKDLQEVEQEFLKRCALHYHERQNSEFMMKFVRQLQSMDSMRSFLRSVNCLDELLLLEEMAGNFMEAASLAEEKGDLVSEADLLAKAGCFEDAARLILVHVFGYSLWATGCTGWPLKNFPNKEALLAKAKKFAMNGTECFYESVFLEATLLSNKECSLPEMGKSLSASVRLGNFRAEIISAWKILGEHLRLRPSDFEWQHDLVLDGGQHTQENSILCNRVSINSLIYFWNYWRCKMENVLYYLQNIGTTNEFHRSYQQFCLDYLGLRKNDSEQYPFYIWARTGASWLKGIDKTSLQRRGDVVYLHEYQFAVAARVYWISVISLLGLKVLGTLDALHKFSVQKSSSLVCQGTIVVHIFEVAKYVMELNNWKCGSSDLQKLPKYLQSSKSNVLDIVFPLEWGKIMTENMILLRGTKAFKDLLEEVFIEIVGSNCKLTYGKIGLTVMILFVSGKLSDELYEKTVRFFNAKPPWKLFITQLKDHIVSRVGQLALACKLKEALQHTFYVNWQEEVDYISPHYFVYLVERLLYLVSSSQKSFFTTKYSLMEALSFWNWEKTSSRSSSAGKPLAMEEYHDFIVLVIDQILVNRNETFKWLEKTRINVKQYHSVLVMRLITLISLICLNSGQYFDYLSILLARDDIKNQLPRAFCETLLKWKSHNFGEVLAEALGTIDNPLVIVRVENNFPGFVCSKALVIDLNVIQSREELLGVLFPKSLEDAQVHKDNFELGAKSSRIINQSPEGADGVNIINFPSKLDLTGKEIKILENKTENEDLDLSEAYISFWSNIDCLSSGTHKYGGCMNSSYNAPQIKFEIGRCIRVLVAAMSYYNLESCRFDVDARLMVEAKSIVDELKQVSDASIVSQDFDSNIERIGEVFGKLRELRPVLQPWLDSVFLESGGRTASKPSKSTGTSAAVHGPKIGNEKNKAKGNSKTKVNKNGRRDRK